MGKIMFNGVNYSAPNAGSNGVEGVKGNEETEYRTGNVNLTPENIGAAKSGIYGDDTVSMGRKIGTSVGKNSFAFGYNVEASGIRAIAFGASYCTVSGLDSVALGVSDATVSGDNSVALGGTYATVSGNNSVALGGTRLKSSNYCSCSLGKNNKSMVAGATDTNQVGDAFVIGNGTGNSNLSNALRVTYQGDVLGTKAFQSSGADYAEFIKPWADGNPDNEDRVGYFVTIKDGYLEKAGEGDYIAGITSGNPSIVGNADEDYYWRYERDEFNRIVMEDVPELAQKMDEDGNPVFDEETHEPVMEETGNIIPNARMKLAEGYEPSLQNTYIERKNRKEWDYVGMLGVLPVRDDGTCIPGQFCRCKGDGVATFATGNFMYSYMVVERVSDNVVSVILK